MNKEYSSFLPVYESYPYNIQRVDAARYFILYHFGGVYLDLDIGCKSNRDLTDLVNTMSHLNNLNSSRASMIDLVISGQLVLSHTYCSAATLPIMGHRMRFEFF